MTRFGVTGATIRHGAVLLFAAALMACAPQDPYDAARRSADGDAGRINYLSAQVCGRYALSQDQIRSLVAQAVQDMPVESLVGLARPSTYASGMSAYGIDRQSALMEWLIAQQAIVYASDRFRGLPHAGPMGVEESLAIRAGVVRSGGQVVLVVDAGDVNDGIRAGAAALSSMYRFNLREAVGVQGYGAAGPRAEYFGLPHPSARLTGVSLDFLQASCVPTRELQQMTSR